jgi:hypothetical protein
MYYTVVDQPPLFLEIGLVDALFQNVVLIFSDNFISTIPGISSKKKNFKNRPTTL